MKLMRNKTIIATYQGVVPVQPYSKDLGNYGITKYIGYDHLFTEVESDNFHYSIARAKNIPCDIPKGARIKMLANFRSSILTNIRVLKENNDVK